MSQARRTLRVPDSVNRTLGDDGDPLWYTGALQTENGRDIATTALPPGVDVKKLLEEPIAVPPSGDHPGRRLKRSK